MTTSRSRTSHTVELAFRLPLDFPHGKIANVPGILMKVGETTRGVPLSYTEGGKVRLGRNP
jgi:hypothetical protein